tara:strand:+ start:6088 stop:7014 length:927 start_codon:yes stop_codon:yes gene_type:complete
MSLKIICPLCESDKIEFKNFYLNNSDIFKNMTRQRCHSCDLQFADPMPSESSLDTYNNSYHDSAHGGQERNIKLQGFFSGISRTRINLINKYIELDPKKEYKLLEIGPGPGAFASIWLEQFPKTKYFAIETDTSCHQALNKMNIKLLEAKEIKDYKALFDIIIISHVLEHVAHPIKFLEPIINCLKKEGFIYIEVPCNDWKHKKIWEPHLLFFDKKPMKKLLKRLNMTLLKIGYFGNTIQESKNIFQNFLKRIRSILYHKLNFRYYHPQRNELNKVLKNQYEIEALLPFDAHIEKENESIWLRVIFKK